MLSAHPTPAPRTSGNSTACSCLQLFAFQPSEPGSSSSAGASSKAPSATSRAALLSLLQPPSGRPSGPGKTNVYGKPLTAGELKAWDAAVDHWSAVPGATDRAALRSLLLDYLYVSLQLLPC